METEDRLLQQIDMMGKVLAKVMADIFHLKYQPSFNLVQPAIWQALKDEAGLDLTAMLDKPSHELVTYLTTEKQLSESHLAQLSDIFYELGRGDEEAFAEADRRNLAHAYALYEYLNRTGKIYSMERDNRLRRIGEKLATEG